MAHNESQSERRGKASALTDVQTELFKRLQEVNEQWIDRVHAEASLASVFVSNLSSARSIPDAINAYQDWSSSRFEMMAEDGQRVLDETQKFMLTGERILRDGFVPKFQNVLP